MNQQQNAAIHQFRSAVKALKAAGVIRSDRFLGDIAEFLCADALGVELSHNLRQHGHDGIRGGKRVQVKYAGGKKTNLDLGDPLAYDELYVVMGEESVVRNANEPGDFLVYRFLSEDVRTMQKPKGNYSCGKAALPARPTHVINLDKFGS